MADLCRVLLVGNFERDVERKAGAGGVITGHTVICAGRTTLVNGYPQHETVRVAVEVVGAALIAEGWLLVAAGSVLATTAIVSLGRSFGMEPAHRGLRVGGRYRIVRHPIYAAYLLIVGGYLSTSWSWWSGLVALGWIAVQVLRIQQEEQLLGTDPDYRAYTETVPYRIIPRVW